MLWSLMSRGKKQTQRCDRAPQQCESPKHYGIPHYIMYSHNVVRITTTLRINHDVVTHQHNVMIVRSPAQNKHHIVTAAHIIVVCHNIVGHFAKMWMATMLWSNPCHYRNTIPNTHNVVKHAHNDVSTWLQEPERQNVVMRAHNVVMRHSIVYLVTTSWTGHNVVT